MCGLNTEGTPLWPYSKEISGLNDIMEASSKRHEYSVDVSFVE